MTTQEIREMLDSTITANGKREISGQSLNTALNAMVDVIERGIAAPPITDKVLNKDSSNPIANSAVATAFEEMETTIEDMVKSKLDILTFDLSSGGTKLREYFSEYDLANKLNTSIPCLVKFNSFDETSLLANFMVEGFDASGKEDGTEMYKISFFSIGITSKIEVDGERYNQRYVWSADCFMGNNSIKAYMYTPSTNMIQSLGDGELYHTPSYEMILKKDLKYDNLRIDRTYYVVDGYANNRILDSILIPIRFGAYLFWYNIKDGAFEEVDMIN